MWIWTGIERRGVSASRALSPPSNRSRCCARVDPLPFEPHGVTEPRAVEIPSQAGFVGTIERERLALQRRKQGVRSLTVGADRGGDRERRKRAEDERGAAPVVDRHGNDRPRQLEALVGPESLVAKPAERDAHSWVDLHVQGDAHRGAEDRLPLAKRVAELRVVAVQQEVGSQRDLLLRADGALGPSRQQHGQHHGEDATSHAPYDTPRRRAARAVGAARSRADLCRW